MNFKLNKETNWKELEKFVKNKLIEEKTGHDWEHIKRVISNAKKIAKTFDNIDYDVLYSSCLLHDISTSKKFTKTHHIESAKMSKSILKNFNFPKEKIQKVYDSILKHNRGYNERQGDFFEYSDEEKILCDADRIDEFGTIGIIRMILFSAKQNIPYIISKNDKLDQSFYGNLKHISQIKKVNSMFTKKGKEIARQRIKIIQELIKEMQKEFNIKN